METFISCPKCKNQVFPTAFFCPNCGYKLRDKPLSTSITSQIGVYLLSLFLPPIGYFRAYKYLRQEGQLSKAVGLIIIIITSFSISLVVWSTLRIIEITNQSINSTLIGV